MTTPDTIEALKVHLFEHDEVDDPTCDHCSVRPMLRKLHGIYFNGTADMVAKMYALNDAYGPTGFVPPQGYDWSGIRDSSPDAIRAMVALFAHV